jgi:hypothetical protein
MIVLGSAQAPLISSNGAFGDVFAFGPDRAIKVLRKVKVTEGPVSLESDHWVVLTAVWDAECSAYELLRTNPELSLYVPGNFARVQVDRIIDEDGRSLSEKYLLSCAFSMDRISGQAQKLGELYGTPGFDAIDAIVDRMISAGVKTVPDGSVFIPGKNAAFTIIDFGTWEAFGELSEILARTGRLPDHVRRRWALPSAA